MNNIFFGLSLSLISTLIYLLFSWNKWKKSGHSWPKTKAEKEKNIKSSRKIIPFAIIAIAILPRLINTTLLFVTTFSFTFFISVLSWKLDPYFRSKNK